jgi:hypothetical protein
MFDDLLQLLSKAIALFSESSSALRTSFTASCSDLVAISGAIMSSNSLVTVLPPTYPTMPLKDPAMSPAAAPTNGAAGPISTANPAASAATGTATAKLTVSAEVLPPISSQNITSRNALAPPFSLTSNPDSTAKMAAPIIRFS